MDIITPQPLASLVIEFPDLILVLDSLKQMDINSPWTLSSLWTFSSLNTWTLSSLKIFGHYPPRSIFRTLSSPNKFRTLSSQNKFPDVVLPENFADVVLPENFSDIVLPEKFSDIVSPEFFFVRIFCWAKKIKKYIRQWHPKYLFFSFSRA